MRRVSGKVSQITRITQRPSGRYPRGLGSLRSRGSHRFHGFHRFHRLDSLRSSDSTDTCRMAICVIRETFSSEKLTRTRHGASLQDGIYGVRWEIWEYWELWEDWEGEGRRWGGRSEGEGTGEGCGVELVSGWRAHCENREGAVAGARRSTGVSEPVRASSRCAARSHLAPSHGFSRALGLLVLLGLPKERKQLCQKKGNRRRKNQ